MENETHGWDRNAGRRVYVALQRGQIRFLRARALLRNAEAPSIEAVPLPVTTSGPAPAPPALHQWASKACFKSSTRSSVSSTPTE